MIREEIVEEKKKYIPSNYFKICETDKGMT